MSKVLIIAPTSQVKNYCIDEYVSNIRAMKVDFKICDNTLNNANGELYKAMNLDVLHVDPLSKTAIQYVTESQNKLRDYFLKNDYTHLLSIESDLLPPVYIVDKLLAHRKGVVSAPYFTHTNSSARLMVQEMSTMNATFGQFRSIPIMDSFLSMDSGLKQVGCMGLGCTLIEREIVEAIPFRCTPDERTQNEAFADSFFASDLARAGVAAWLDTSITITHLNQNWLTTRIN